jgi:Domain of unknown function (DUF4129)
MFRVSYVLRNFYSLSRTDGADLLSRLQAVKRPVAAAIAALISLAAPLAAENAATPPDPTPVESSAGFSSERAELADAIRHTLERREYQWRLPRQTAETGPTGGSAMISFLERVRRAIAGFLEDVDQTIRRWGKRIFGGRSIPSGSLGAAGLEASAFRGLIFLLGGTLLGYLMVVGVRAWQRRTAAALTGKQGESPHVVDLGSDQTLPSQLPEDQWLRLAREQLAAGDARLAVRALFLATLATLGEQRLIEIARSKSNRDYREELGFRVRVHRELVEAFGENVGIFERVWYGLHQAGQDVVERLISNYQQIKSARSA